MKSSPAPFVAPASSEIEHTFRRIVRELCHAGDLENLTVKRVRSTAEERLGLPAGFFRQESSWKERSKRFIEAEAVSHLLYPLSSDRKERKRKTLT
jgi:hypothetical protein